MIKNLRISDNQLKVETGFLPYDTNTIWIDLISPTEEEKKQVEKAYGIELFTEQESEEIESSSRYNETETEIGININFLRLYEGVYLNEAVSFILKDDFLITQREDEYKSFTDTYRRIRTIKPKNGIDLFMTIFEMRIDFDADFIENITEKTTRVSRGLVESNDLERELLLEITAFQESTIVIRENIVEKQRILSAILKSKLFSQVKHDNVRIMLKDVGSLLDHTSFNFERLEFLQNTFLGLVDMEQNRIIKIFTVVTVIFMPPTLIASLYGMNFRIMPELDYSWGYPFAVGLMIFSSVITLLFFRRKNWL